MSSQWRYDPRMLKIVVATAALMLCGAPLATADPTITPDEWGMDDGRGVGPRVAGAACLAAEAHQWADSGTGTALWCPPPAFVWVPAA